MAQFSHLSVHSHYSLLNAIPQIDPLVETAVNFGMPAMALTDRNNLYGAIEFYKACTKKGIKPIIGVDMDVSVAGATGHIILLAENFAGYQNLMKLVSHANNVPNEPPLARDEDFVQYGTGLIALIPDTALLQPNAGALVEHLKRTLGAPSVYARLGWNGGREHALRTAGVASAL